MKVLLADGSYHDFFIAKDANIATVPIVINPNYLFKGNLNFGVEKVRTERQKANECNLLANDHNQTLSKKARKNIQFCLNWMYASARTKTVWNERTRTTFTFKTNMITLTIPSKDGSIVPRNEMEEFMYKDGKRLNNPNFKPITEDQRTNIVDEKTFQTCFNSFLTYMRKFKGLGNYLWKLEAQHNGQLHIHLTTDQYIKWNEIRDVWNKILQKNNLLDVYFSKRGHFTPNSTDVHSTKNMYNACLLYTSDAADE